MADTPETVDDGELSALLAWLEVVQTASPEGVAMADPAGAALKAMRAADAAGLDLPFDSEPTGITPLLESLARK